MGTTASMSLRVEIYATANTPPDDLWAVVGDPWRLPEWTDVHDVERVDPDPVEVGAEIVVVADGQRRRCTVVTAAPRLLEVTTSTARGPVGIGARVIRDRAGSRLVLAGAFSPAGAVQRLRVRAVDAPALRRRFDRWSRRALELAAAR